jgi:hypothetical protein
MPATARQIDFGHGNQRAELPLLEPTLRSEEHTS